MQLGFSFLKGDTGARRGPSPIGQALARLAPVKRYSGDWPWWFRRQRSLFVNEPWPSFKPEAFRRSCRDPVAQRRRGLRSGIVRRHRVADRDRGIVNLMRLGGRYSAAEIAEDSGVSRRTVWRVWRAYRFRQAVARRVFQRRRLEAELTCDTNPLKRPPSAKNTRRSPALPSSGQARSARFAALWRLRDETAARRHE